MPKIPLKFFIKFLFLNSTEQQLLEPFNLYIPARSYHQQVKLRIKSLVEFRTQHFTGSNSYGTSKKSSY